MIPLLYVSYALICFGLAFQFLGSIALHRFPDVYTRMHGTTMCTTFGSIFIILGIAFYGLLQSDTALFLHPLVALVFLLLTNPTGTHAIARAARFSGIKPKHAITDSLAGGKK